MHALDYMKGIQVNRESTYIQKYYYNKAITTLRLGKTLIYCIESNILK
jgi:hypothetical protein